VLVVPLRRATAGELSPVLARPLLVLRPFLIGTTLVVATLSTAWSFARDDGAAFFYQRAWKAFSAQNYATALPNFERSLWLGGETSTASDAAFFIAATLLRQGKPAEAMAGYQRVIDQFPDAVWVAESHYHVGLCLRQLNRLPEARQKFQFVIDTYPGNRWAGFAKEQLQQITPQGG
jgi:TolA-binding protein